MGRLSDAVLAEIRANAGLAAGRLGTDYLKPENVYSLLDHIDALESDLRRAERRTADLERERHWAAHFHCPNCGVIGAGYITTKKTCLHCDAGLIRSKHPMVKQLESDLRRAEAALEVLSEAVNWATTETFLYESIDGRDYVSLNEWFRRITKLEQALRAARQSESEAG